MKKLIGILLFVSQFALALNFSGVQSMNGLNSVQVFSAPATGYYFVNGQVSLGLPTQNGNTLAAGAFVVVSKNGTTATPVLLYTGLPGSTGFQIRNISLVTGDTINARFFSTVSGSGIQGGGDATLNALSGQVWYGNTY